MTSPKKVRVTEKGNYVYARAQELICEGMALGQAYETAEKEAEELDEAGAWRPD